MAVHGTVVKAKVETVRARTAAVPGVPVRNSVPSVPARKAAAAVKPKVLTIKKGSAAKGIITTGAKAATGLKRTEVPPAKSGVSSVPRIREKSKPRSVACPRSSPAKKVTEKTCPVIQHRTDEYINISFPEPAGRRSVPAAPVAKPRVPLPVRRNPGKPAEPKRRIQEAPAFPGDESAPAVEKAVAAVAAGRR